MTVLTDASSQNTTCFQDARRVQIPRCEDWLKKNSALARPEYISFFLHGLERRKVHIIHHQYQRMVNRANISNRLILLQSPILALSMHALY